MSNEELSPIESLSMSEKSWLINELAKTDNRPELKNRYKRIFGKSVPDLILASLCTEYEKDIAELKQLLKRELDTHEYSSSFKRMDEYKDILKECKEGYVQGFNEFGPIVKKDPANALAALRQMREEKQTQVANDLKLLQILVQSDRLSINAGGSSNKDALDHLEPETVDVKVESDNDQFFPGS